VNACVCIFVFKFKHIGTWNTVALMKNNIEKIISIDPNFLMFLCAYVVQKKPPAKENNPAIFAPAVLSTTLGFFYGRLFQFKR
jgi:hypothetical protein